MKLKIELDSDDLEGIVRAEITRRFPALRIEELYVPYIGRDVKITLNDEPEPVPAAPVEEAA